LELGSGGTINTPGGLALDTILGVSNDLSWVRGRHSFHVGADIRFLHLNRADPSDMYGGEYDFSAGDTNSGSAGGSALAAFELGIINQFHIKEVLTTFRYRWQYYAGYLQDDFRVSNNLTLNLGIRYNVETPRYEVNNQQGSFIPTVNGTVSGTNTTGAFVFAGSAGRSRYMFPINFKGVEPRIGLAFVPRSWMTVHASYSLIHAPLSGIGAAVVPDLSVPNQNFTNGGGGQNSTYWANYVTNPIGTINPPIQQTSGVIYVSPNSSASFPYVDQSNSVPYVQLYGASLQFQVSRNAVFGAAYSGSSGHHLFTPPITYNVPSLSNLLNSVQTHQNLGSATYNNPFGLGKENGLQLLRPYQNFAFDAVNSAYDRYGSSNYNALLLNYNQRLSAGLLVMAGYSWQKSMDNASSGYTDGNSEDIFGIFNPQTPYTYQGEWSLSTYDIPSRATAGYSYMLPFGRGKQFLSKSRWVDLLVGGFSTGGVFSMQSGYPLAIELGNNGYWFSTTYTYGPNGTGTGTSRCTNGNGGSALTGAVLRPNRVPGVAVINPQWRNDPFGITTGTGFINRAAFSVPGSLDNPALGNVPRTLGAIRNPRSAFFDVTLRKAIQIHDQHTLTLAANVINVMNHTNFFVASKNIYGSFNATTNTFAPPSSVAGAMGQTSQTPGREIQFEARYSF
jgi:hypothetical protein